jgi:hypothetical protein
LVTVIRHTEVKVGSIPYSYEEGEKAEVMIASKLKSARIKLSDIKIKRIDFIVGADHGAGAFLAGCKIVILYESRDQPMISIPTPKSGSVPHEQSIVFDVSLAEVICRKDTSDLIQKTIGKELTAGFKTIAQKQLTIGLDDNDEIQCSFGGEDSLSKEFKPDINLYVMGDLVFYAMVLGRESLSSSRCFMCRMSSKDFSKSMKQGDPWTYELMREFVDKMTDKSNSQ